MRTMMGGLLIAATALAAVSCFRMAPHGAPDICSNVSAGHVCAVPFEVMYAQRETLSGRLIRLDGVLVVGVRSEPPGSETTVALLFPSMERARMCNPEFAIELLASSKQVADDLRNASGRFVSVVGRSRPSPRGHWSQLEVMTPPALVSSEQEDFQCMTAPPPPLLEP